MSDSDATLNVSAPANQTICSNCNSVMPSELRFCRNCGFRLTSLAGTYTGTQYPDVMPVGSGTGSAPLMKKRRMSGMSWLFVGLLVFFVCAAAFTALVAPVHRSTNIGVSIPVNKSYIGVDEFNKTEDGVIFEAVSAPGGPADKAGLVGGDIIVSFDGQKIEDDDQMDELMQKTPVGKTVDVEYIRDGVKKTTKLTTISREEFNRLSREFDRRPEGRAQFGYEDGDAERVQIPGTDLYGVKLGTILRSRPADIAGIKNDDIVTEFDGVPIRTSQEFLMRVRRALPYTTVKLVVMRKGEGEKFEKLEIPVKMGKQ
jgi:membrane-associated protease RseP (regulator of RpoE activity)